MSAAMRRPIAVDLFAGAGGLSLGIEQAGFDIVAAVEFDPIHAAIHALNFPNTPVICRDVRDLRGEEIRVAAGVRGRDIDLVVGGPPCQGFSLIGHRVLEDSRNALVFEFFRLVTELQPRVFVMENVPGMATGRHTQLLDELIERFERAGYRVRYPYRTLNAANYGVPQNRTRLFLIGARDGEILPHYPQPTTSYLAATRRRGAGPALVPDDFLGLRPCPTVRDAIADLPNIEDFPYLFDTDELRIDLTGGSHYAQRLRGDVVDPEDYSHPRLTDRALLTGCLRARHTPESRARFAATPPGTTEPVSRFYRLAWDGVCNTLRAGTASDRGAFSAPRPIHPEHPRCISVREAARLHSFPDWFRFHRTIWHGFRQIGNSVPPLLARAVGASVRDALGITPVRPDEGVALGPAEVASFNMREAAAFFGVSPSVIPGRRRTPRTTA